MSSRTFLACANVQSVAAIKLESVRSFKESAISSSSLWVSTWKLDLKRRSNHVQVCSCSSSMKREILWSCSKLACNCQFLDRPTRDNFAPLKLIWAFKSAVLLVRLAKEGKLIMWTFCMVWLHKTRWASIDCWLSAYHFFLGWNNKSNSSSSFFAFLAASLALVFFNASVISSNCWVISLCREVT